METAIRSSTWKCTLEPLASATPLWALGALLAIAGGAPISSPGATPEPCSLSVVSLNMAKESNAERVLRDLRTVPNVLDADVLLLQEVVNPDGKASVAEELALRLGRFVEFAPAAPRIYDQGLAIVSRYPIAKSGTRPLKAYNLRFRSRTRIAMAASLETPHGNVNVWNAHLDTRINSGERLQQLAPVLEEAALHTGPQIVGGDFNSNSFYWIGNVLPLPAVQSQGRAVRQAFELRGFQTPFRDGVATFPLFAQQLDWIFVSRLEASGAGVMRVGFSDHHAIWTLVRMPCQTIEN
jgi:endonuclease/exonuclease/phosphatase family metal-dependent hydrolase